MDKWFDCNGRADPGNIQAEGGSERKRVWSVFSSAVKRIALSRTASTFYCPVFTLAAAMGACLISRVEATAAIDYRLLSVRRVSHSLFSIPVRNEVVVFIRSEPRLGVPCELVSRQHKVLSSCGPPGTVQCIPRPCTCGRWVRY